MKVELTFERTITQRMKKQVEVEITNDLGSLLRHVAPSAATEWYLMGQPLDGPKLRGIEMLDKSDEE